MHGRRVRCGSGTALVVVDRAGLAVAPPLLLGSGQEDLIKFCRETQKEADVRDARRRGRRLGVSIHLNPGPVGTWSDVQLVPDGQAPHSSSDSRRKTLPPELPDPPRPLPEHTHTHSHTVSSTNTQPRTCRQWYVGEDLHGVPVRQDLVVPDHHGVGDTVLLPVSLLHLSLLPLGILHL